MNKHCQNCEFARYTSPQEKVGCAYWSAKYYEENGFDTPEAKRNADMILSGLNQIWLGWVFLKRRPEKEESDIFGEGIMTNGCVITGEKDSCKQFLART